MSYALTSRPADARAIADAVRGHLSALLALEPEDVLRLADDQGVSALVWDALDRTPGTAPAVKAALDTRVRADATRDLLVQAEMRRVLDAIAAAGERVVVFKGAALAYTVYRQPWHRPRTDTDVLTSRAGVDGVGRALESYGYRRSDALSTGELVSHQVAFERTDSHGLLHVVDLHWKVVNPQALADAIPFEEVWATSEPAATLGRAARVPSRIVSVVLACMHRLAHHQGHDRLIWLQDLALLVSAFDAEDWRALADLATERRVAALCADGLSRADDALGIGLPEEVRTRLVEAGRTEPSRHYVDAAVGRRDVLLSDLKALEGWRARLRLLREHAFPSPAFVLQRYGVRSAAWLPLLYAHRLVTGAFRWTRP